MSATIVPERRGGSDYNPNFIRLSYQDLERVRKIMEDIEMDARTDKECLPLDDAEKRTLVKVKLVMGKMEEKRRRDATA